MLRRYAHTRTHAHAVGFPSNGARWQGTGQRGQGPTEKAMGLRLAPLGAPVWVLVLLVPPETAEALHESLWPQER